MCLGLSFIGCSTTIGNITSRRYLTRNKKARKRRLAVAQSHVSSQEREVLDSIQLQIKDKSPLLSDRKCLECDRLFILITVGGIEMDYCIHCKSCWFDVGELQAVTGTYRDVPGDDMKSRESKFKCPVCQDVMREYVYMRPYTLLVDQCTHGHGVYLQDKELEKAFELTYE